MKKFWIFLFALFLTGCAEMTSQTVVETTEMTEMFFFEMHTEPDAGVSTEPTAVNIPDIPLLSPLVDPKASDFVRVKDYIPDILTELKYAAADNFTGHVIYEFEDVFLRYGTVMKLKAVREELEQLGFNIKIWDGFRPVSAQFKLWEICPDDTFVADPNVGYSNHSRGFAVDLTLVDDQGRELSMPTGFDDFSAAADRDYSDCDPHAAENARLLEAIMEKHGFSGYWGEWWHFNDRQKYDVEASFDPALISRRYVASDAELLESFWDPDSGILNIPEGEAVTLLGFREEYSLVEYWGYRGYLPSAFLRGN